MRKKKDSEVFIVREEYLSKEWMANDCETDLNKTRAFEKQGQV